MNQSKKSLIAFSGLLMLVAIVFNSSPIFAKTGDPAQTVILSTDSTSVNKGDTLSVNIQYTHADQYAVAGLKFFVHYNSSKLEFDSTQTNVSFTAGYDTNYPPVSYAEGTDTSNGGDDDADTETDKYVLVSFGTTDQITSRTWPYPDSTGLPITTPLDLMTIGFKATATTATTTKLTVTSNSYDNAYHDFVGNGIDTISISAAATGPAAPTFSPASGSTLSASPSTITVTAATDAANTYYTTDGTDPTNASTALTGSTISISDDADHSVTVKAVSYNANGDIGAVGTATYTFNNIPSGPAAPTFSPASGSTLSASPSTITVTAATDAANTYYTTDGTDPTNTSTALTGSTISISDDADHSVTVKAISYNADSVAGSVGTATYTFPSGPVAPALPTDTNLTVSPASLTVTPATGAVETYYTTDGSTPDKTSTTSTKLDSTNSISITKPTDGTSVTLKIVSYDASGNAGFVKSVTYTFGAMLGDADGDGSVTIYDALTIAKHVVSLPVDKYVEDNSDVDCSGSVDINDALLIAEVDAQMKDDNGNAYAFCK